MYKGGEILVENLELSLKWVWIMQFFIFGIIRLRDWRIVRIFFWYISFSLSEILFKGIKKNEIEQDIIIYIFFWFFYGIVYVNLYIYMCINKLYYVYIIYF